MNNCHLPVPSTSTLFSRSKADRVRVSPAGSVNHPDPPLPRSSMPSTNTLSSFAPVFARRSLLSWFMLPPGLKVCALSRP